MTLSRSLPWIAYRLVTATPSVLYFLEELAPLGSLTDHLSRSCGSELRTLGFVRIFSLVGLYLFIETFFYPDLRW